MNANIKIALLLAVATLVWLASGFFEGVDTETAGDFTASKLTKVEVQRFTTQQFNPQLSLRAKTEPHRVIELTAQLSGRVAAVPGRRGVSIEQGQPVCVIELEDQQLRVDSAEAQLRQAEIAYRGALQLETAGYQSELAIAQAKANLESAKLLLKQSQNNLEDLIIESPLAGIVETRPVEAGDYIVPGQLCAKVVELDPIKVIADVAETDVVKLRLGDRALAEFSSESPIQATISYIAHQASPNTRSYRVEATLQNPEMLLRAGMSGRLKINQPPIQAHLVPASSILLDATGSPVVRTILNEGYVAQSRVSLIGETDRGVWVKGLPESIDLITTGQNYVAEGELVEASSRFQLTAD